MRQSAHRPLVVANLQADRFGTLAVMGKMIDAKPALRAMATPAKHRTHWAPILRPMFGHFIVGALVFGIVAVIVALRAYVFGKVIPIPSRQVKSEQTSV